MYNGRINKIISHLIYSILLVFRKLYCYCLTRVFHKSATDLSLLAHAKQLVTAVVAK